MLWIIYNLLFPVAFLFMLPKFLTRMVRRGGYRQNFGQRLGLLDAQTKVRLQAHQRIWVHAVSVGEIYVALRFIRAYREVHPDAHFALSTTTSTAQAIGRKEIDSRDVLFYFPLDLPLVMRNMLNIIKPLRLILVEGEFWPNLIRLANKQGILISLINGRLSEKSCKGYKALKALTSDVLRRINPICVQSKKDAERMAAIGAPEAHVHLVGTVKFDVAERDPAGEELAREILNGIGIPEDAMVLLGGSTWPGEEAVLCDIYQSLRSAHPDLFLILVPRHVERASEVIACLEQRNLTYLRRSKLDDFRSVERPDVLFVDTTGELRNFYSVAEIIFVGKSLLEHGGQNPIEPAMCGKVVIVGPHMENFPAVMPVLLDGQAIVQIEADEDLETTVASLLDDEARRTTLGIQAAQVVEANRGALQQTVCLLEKV